MATLQEFIDKGMAFFNGQSPLAAENEKLRADLQTQTELAASMADSLNKHKGDFEAAQTTIKTQEEIIAAQVKEIEKLKAEVTTTKQSAQVVIASIGVDPVKPDKPAADAKAKGFRELVIEATTANPKLSKAQVISKVIKENPAIHSEWLQSGGGNL